MSYKTQKEVEEEFENEIDRLVARSLRDPNCKPITELKNFIPKVRTADLDAQIEHLQRMKKEEFFETFDNDIHRYQIPRSKRDEWFKFMEIPSDDERSWDVPEWAERIDGMPIKENHGYNQAIDDHITYLESLKKTND